MSELARRYAVALFSLEADERRLRKDAALLTGNAPLWGALRNPCIPVPEKRAVLARLLEGETKPMLLNFYKLLCGRGRMGLLPEILTAYHQCVLESENAADAEMRCVTPPTEAQRQALARALCGLHGKQRVDLHIAEDPSLMGGFVLKIGDVAYDRSIRGMLRDMRGTVAG